MDAHLPLRLDTTDRLLPQRSDRTFGTARRTDPVPAPALFPPVQRTPSIRTADAYARYGGLGLTAPQSHVFALLSEGRTNREIADELQITLEQATNRVQDVLSVLRARPHATPIAS